MPRPEFTCTYCQEEHSTLCNLRTHLVKHLFQEMVALRPSREWSCTDCDRTFVNRFTTIRHFGIRHGLVEEAAPQDLREKLEALAAQPKQSKRIKIED